MTFALSDSVYILVAQWRVLSDKGLSGSFVAVFAFAVFFECLRSYNVFRKYTSNECKISTRKQRLQDLSVETVLYFIQLVMTYLLMLMAMTYNVWIFVAVIFGCATGYFMAIPILNRFITIEVCNSRV